ncbi:phage tail tape measure C-terminal domain-containing protein [Deferrisoma camini]|uniref:phage tail tape measure C-terminal domain-containing protein n=1 Tax=Deferrisoma camini TaxID=1035120 RepID=UPI00046D89AA|nr:phage tail tape measure C-terminal domain-containing protein [Deferrisoma camini]
MADARLNVKFTVRDEGAPVIERVRRNFRRMADDGARAGKDVSSAWKTALGVFAGMGALNLASSAIRGLAGAVRDFVGETLELAEIQETAEGRMEAVLRATGGAVGYTADQLKRMAAEFQDALGMGDEEILRLQAVMLTFRNVTGDTFREAIELTADMAFVMGTDARSAAIQLGKALNDPIQGVSALRRVGVSFTEQQKEQIRALQESGDLIGAQRIILAELRQEFGGVSRAMDGTWKRAATNLANAWGDLKEEIGKLVTENRGTIEFLNDLTDAIKKLGKAVDEFRHPDLVGQELTMLRWQLDMATTPEMREAIQRRIDVLTAAERAAEVPADPWLEAWKRRKALPPEVNTIIQESAKSHAQAYWEAYARAMAQLRESAPAVQAPSLPSSGFADLRRLDEMLNGRRALPGVYGAGETSGLAFLRQWDEAFEEQAREIAALTDNATTNPLRRLKEVTEQDQRVIDEITEHVRKNAKLRAEAEKTWLTGARDGLREYADDALKTYDEVAQAVQGAFAAMEDALVRFVRSGKLSFREFADAVIEDLARIAIRAQITGPLAQIVGGWFGATGASPAPAPATASPAGPSIGGSGWWNNTSAPRLAPRVAAGAAGAGPVQVTVINQSGVPVDVRERPGSMGREVEIWIGRTVAGDIDRGGDVAQAIQRVFGLTRRGY